MYTHDPPYPYGYIIDHTAAKLPELEVNVTSVVCNVSFGVTRNI